MDRAALDPYWIAGTESHSDSNSKFYTPRIPPNPTCAVRAKLQRPDFPSHNIIIGPTHTMPLQPPPLSISADRAPPLLASRPSLSLSTILRQPGRRIPLRIPSGPAWVLIIRTRARNFREFAASQEYHDLAIFLTQLTPSFDAPSHKILYP